MKLHVNPAVWMQTTGCECFQCLSAGVYVRSLHQQIHKVLLQYLDNIYSPYFSINKLWLRDCEGFHPGILAFWNYLFLVHQCFGNAVEIAVSNSTSDTMNYIEALRVFLILSFQYGSPGLLIIITQLIAALFQEKRGKWSFYKHAMDKLVN